MQHTFNIIDFWYGDIVYYKDLVDKIKLLLKFTPYEIDEQYHIRYHLFVTIDELEKKRSVKFKDLLHLCTQYFGNPRIRGSHHIFKMPWQGDPRINIQKDGNMAKNYQVKAVIKAIRKMEEMNG